ncbi:MAG: PQQ-binding-like beta-propeller repeat protein [Chloroflexota bacterium]|nr:PQQ-binding-like beta-propeller repeat protein [Chloroflexota bacterium]
MKFWQNISTSFRSQWALVGLLALLLLAFTGCSGAARAESWPGLLVHEDILYAANGAQVQAFESQTGKSLWAFPAEADAKNKFYSAPVIDTERNLLLVAGFKDKTVYALRLGDSSDQTPGLAWAFSDAGGQYVGSGTIAGDLFLIGNGDGQLYAINLADGSLEWSFATRDRIWTTPLVVDETVYVASSDHHLYALKVSDGVEQWQLETKGALASSPVWAADHIWLGDFGDQLYQIDPQAGEVVWTFEDGENWFWATPLVLESTIYFADVGGAVFAFDINSHELLWRTDIKAVFRGQGIVDTAGGRLLLPAYERGLIYALDAKTGDKLPWGEVMENPGRLPGSLVTDGERVYAAPIMITTRAQVFEISDGKELWHYPVAEEK